jgi:hypothetical protein
MLRKFAAALLATALIAGPAFAAPPAGGGSTPATVSTTVAKPAVKHAKMVKHLRRHVVRHRVGKIKMARHFKAHRHHIAAPVVKHGKVGKINKITKSNHS